MPEQQTVMHGIDTEELAAFGAEAAENPEAVQFGLEARATYEGTTAHSLARVDRYECGGETFARETRAYTIPYGGWKEVLEQAGWVNPTDRLEPVESALSALAACINVGISLNAVAHGVDIDSLATRVRTEFNPAVLFGLADLHQSDGVFENITADIEVAGEGVEKDSIDEWARRAPVYSLFSLDQDVEVTIDTPHPVPTGE